MTNVPADVGTVDIGAKVVRIDAEAGCMLIRGAVPGPRSCTVVVRNAVKKTK